MEAAGDVSGDLFPGRDRPRFFLPGVQDNNRDPRGLFDQITDNVPILAEFFKERLGPRPADNDMTHPVFLGKTEDGFDDIFPLIRKHKGP